MNMLQLERECRSYTRYLTGQAPTRYVIEKYSDFHQKMGAAEGRDRFDCFLVRTSARGPLWARLADSYGSVWRKNSPVRKKLVLTLALLESASPELRRSGPVPGRRLAGGHASPGPGFPELCGLAGRLLCIIHAGASLDGGQGTLMDPIVVVGSGASGVHFALTALRKGRRVTMLDAGHTGQEAVLPDETLAGLKRKLPDPALYFLGPRYESLVLPGSAANTTPFPRLRNTSSGPVPSSMFRETASRRSIPSPPVAWRRPGPAGVTPSMTPI